MDFKKNPDTDFKDVEELSEKEAEEEIEALREGIDYHDRRYYVQNDPAVSDAVYDKLFARLEDLEEAFPDLRSESSPTRRVGAPPADELERVEHTAPMLSLDAVLDKKEVRDYFDFVRRKTGKNDNAWVLEPKFDGASVEVVYEKGVFKRGATRGDGRIGEDVTANMATVRTLPLRLGGENPPDFLAVRGEVFLPKEAFQKLNRQRVENGEDPFANPRNACAGTLRRLESKIVARWPLDIFFYEILQIEGEEFDSHWDELQAFEEWDLKTDPHNRRASGFDEVADFRKKIGEQRDELAYEVDGIVVKLDDLALRRELGTRHRSPRWAIAWKFEPKREVTTLEKIVVQVGTSGILTPVALLDPVDVGGVTVSRATLHNEGEVKEKDLRQGDRVRIERAGDVIPEVVERVERPNKSTRKFRMPDECPSCGTAVVREGAYVLCPGGLSCRAQLKGRIKHYGSREALDIEHLGEETAKQLVEREMVASLADLYRLKPDELEQLEGFAEKSARQLHEAIRQTREPRLDRFLYALSIRHVGQRMAQTLARHFGSLDKLMDADPEDLEEIGDVGPEIARSLVRFFEENADVIKALRQAGVRVKPMPAGDGSMPLEGKTFVFTGALENYTRSEAEQAVEGLGGRATSSVSGNTDYLVVGDEPGGKREEAEERGVRIIDEDEFAKLIARN
ncbi:MAG: NAD-dependent DNA ligase LigA, partial [Desulfuromonadales bacterium]|nr:NAD-dependent DNA ligase LigA [Desulfuromonadales bacterium]NIR33673.1 NAD-dependent DNA ligase LigA [Desulfuromonadales bacterium]NIS41284.1 NAD-dependent DNA ligase LigA [Desulfuromonadales bacterium]